MTTPANTPHAIWLRSVTHSTFDFYRFEALARCHGAADHIEHLERANAALVAENAGLKEWNQQRAGEFACTEQRLASEVARLTLDKERLDWLEAHPLKAGIHGGADDGSTGTFWGLGAANVTLREAIDTVSALKP